MDTLELQASRAKIYQQANFRVVGFKIVHGLREVNIFQFNNSFRFNHNAVFDKKISAPGAEDCHDFQMRP